MTDKPRAWTLVRQITGMERPKRNEKATAIGPQIDAGETCGVIELEPVLDPIYRAVKIIEAMQEHLPDTELPPIADVLNDLLREHGRLS